ncbi:MAG: hypothetical protein FD143_3136 [Ignavibacteria bacterium]|nr:MAG: hypothetical protein FD143_3136 [Ignavibacteria bacterium]
MFSTVEKAWNSTSSDFPRNFWLRGVPKKFGRGPHVVGGFRGAEPPERQCEIFLMKSMEISQFYPKKVANC